MQTYGNTSEVGKMSCCKCLSWTAIFAGALIAVGLSFLFNLLNAGLGLSALSMDNAGVTGIAAGGLIWLILTGIIAMFIAGWVTGRLASPFTMRPIMGVLHALVAWVIALIISVMLAAHVSHLVASGMQLIPGKNAPMFTGYDRRSPASTVATEARTMDADKASAALGMGAAAAFFIFVTGAAAAAFGGYMGAKRREGDETFHRHD